MTAAREPWQCRYGWGSRWGCEQPVSLVDGRDEGLCIYHGKLEAGLFACPSLGCVLAEGHKGLHPQAASRPRGGLSPSDVLTNEQLELGRALGILIAPRQADPAGARP